MVRDPRTFILLPEDGAVVPDSFFWKRRLRDADVVLVDDAPKPAQEGETVS
jgi:hypothetical protein